jgi:hypothetical protein
MTPREDSQHLPCAFNVFSPECIDELKGEGGVFDLESNSGLTGRLTFAVYVGLARDAKKRPTVSGGSVLRRAR